LVLVGVRTQGYSNELWRLAIALGVGCAERGQRLLFLTALELARRMKTPFAQNRMPHYLKMLTTPRLLIVHEVGYLGLDHEQASLLFQVICCRYKKQAATIITSNKAFSDWGHVFAGDAVIASAALDRLLHRATVINIKGDSYRIQEKRLTGLFSGTVALSEATKGGARPKTK
jgi:DNA replication protein DnaC